MRCTSSGSPGGHGSPSCFDCLAQFAHLRDRRRSNLCGRPLVILGVGGGLERARLRFRPDADQARQRFMAADRRRRSGVSCGAAKDPARAGRRAAAVRRQVLSLPAPGVGRCQLCLWSSGSPARRVEAIRPRTVDPWRSSRRRTSGIRSGRRGGCFFRRGVVSVCPGWRGRRALAGSKITPVRSAHEDFVVVVLDDI